MSSGFVAYFEKDPKIVIVVVVAVTSLFGRELEGYTRPRPQDDTPKRGFPQGCSLAGADRASLTRRLRPHQVLKHVRVLRPAV